ncbi:MAG TPA: hypothetical protein VGN14_17965 [Candidatus Elarobacter sp.]|jgi:hypothetical protein
MRTPAPRSSKTPASSRSSSTSAALLALALLGAAPATPSPKPATLTVVCRYAPFYVFDPGVDRPSRAPEHAATMGERFALVSGPRTTLEGEAYYETGVDIVEPGRRGHYWLGDRCALPTSR